MHTIETRLCGRQASVAGITGFINRHLGDGPFSRVEVRYSIAAAAPFSAQAAKQAIGNLLRENGMLATLVSVRVHEGPLDAVTGEHVLRLVPAAVPARAAAGAPDAPWPRWLSRLLPRRLAPAAPPAAPPAPLGISAASAVAHLRLAVKLAAAHSAPDGGEVAQARITVRLPLLHAALQPLVDENAVETHKSLAEMLRRHGLEPASTFKVRYVFVPRAHGDGTGLATESDIDVALRRAGPDAAGGTAAPEPTRAPPVSAWRKAPPAETSTALPAGTMMPAPAPLVTIRVLGTAWEDFALPFELHRMALPLTFNRQLLADAGFGKLHPRLLQVASNSVPLLIESAAGGGFTVCPAPRHAGGAARTPMYHQRQSRQALAGALPVPAGRVELLVNAPGGVLDGASGEVVPALVIEVLAARLA
ncbi:MAG: hypothetical protein V4857_11240 [Pseudomonadota bacterium]